VENLIEIRIFQFYLKLLEVMKWWCR